MVDQPEHRHGCVETNASLIVLNSIHTSDIWPVALNVLLCSGGVPSGTHTQGPSAGIETEMTEEEVATHEDDNTDEGEDTDVEEADSSNESEEESYITSRTLGSVGSATTAMSGYRVMLLYPDFQRVNAIREVC